MKVARNAEKVAQTAAGTATARRIADKASRNREAKALTRNAVPVVTTRAVAGTLPGAANGMAMVAVSAKATVMAAGAGHRADAECSRAGVMAGAVSAVSASGR